MGLSKKNQVTKRSESSDGKKWVIAGIVVRGQLRSISTKPQKNQDDNDGDDENNNRPTTPTAKEARIPERFPCPPAPRKPMPSSYFTNGVMRDQFFTPPDLESVFIPLVKRSV